MTTEEKIKLLEDMLGKLQDSNYWRVIQPCLCGAYHYFTNIHASEEDLNELGLFRPDNNRIDVYWWAQGDTNSRVQACKDAIVKHKEDLAKQTAVKTNNHENN